MDDDRPSATDLVEGDLVVIAGRAGGMQPRTVNAYLLGLRGTQKKKRRAIEAALRELGWEHLIRAPDNTQSRARSTPPEGRLVGVGRR